MARVLAAIPADRPLKGVFHAAGTTAPALMVDSTDENLRLLYRPKVDGSLVLHALTRELDLDLFVGFSSAAATWGASLLGPYGAANHFIDALVHHRRSQGLPGLSVNWGGWSGGGMASVEVQQYAARMGLQMAPAAHFLEALDLLLQQGTERATVGPVDWTLFKAVMESRGPRPLLEHLGSEVQASAGGQLVEALGALPESARWAFLLDAVRQEVASVLGYTDPLSLDPQQGFFQLGMDSVMSVQLRNGLERAVGRPLPPTLAFEQPTVEALSAWLAREILGLEPPSTGEPPAEEPDLDSLSEEELEALLAAELDGTAP